MAYSPDTLGIPYCSSVQITLSAVHYIATSIRMSSEPSVMTYIGAELAEKYTIVNEF